MAAGRALRVPRIGCRSWRSGPSQHRATRLRRHGGGCRLSQEEAPAAPLLQRNPLLPICFQPGMAWARRRGRRGFPQRVQQEQRLARRGPHGLQSVRKRPLGRSRGCRFSDKTPSLRIARIGVAPAESAGLHLEAKEPGVFLLRRCRGLLMLGGGREAQSEALLAPLSRWTTRATEERKKGRTPSHR